MLLTFAVENYRCLKNKVSFSFEVMDDLSCDMYFNPESRREIPNYPTPINTVSAIYGANASGKTTLLGAVIKLFSLIMNSRKNNEDDDFGLEPFDNTLPVRFHVEFLQEGTHYGYQVELMQTMASSYVVSERLDDLTHAQVFFSRDHNTVTSDSLLNEKHKELLTNSLEKNHLVLSQPFNVFKPMREVFSRQNNDYYMMELMSPRLRRHLFFQPNIFLDMLAHRSMQERLQEDTMKAYLLQEMQQADFTIQDFTFDDDELIFIDTFGNKRSFAEQSSGTRKYFILLMEIKDAILDNGGLYIVDELENAMHPRLALRLISMFKNPATNPKHARLLFSSHDLGFLHQSVLNGDQVWFIERDKITQETALFSPAQDVNFDPLNLQAEYFQGLYGAVPNTECLEIERRKGNATGADYG